ncbi:MAG: type I methionyl aminopeptidase [Ignavibacteria bacterium RBG_16_34_14]|nr:MAG: type I methionyl aminopeptidase [Ignavibacteria bacterium RBG_16_34_14]
MIYIKTKKEIDLIRESCKIVAETLQLLKANVKPGITTFELDKIADNYIRSNNAKAAFKGYSQAGSFKFPGSICTSVDDAVVHGIPGQKVLNNGEIISLDVGVFKNGYYGDAALTVPVGTISEEKQKLLDVTEKSLYMGIEEAKENNRLHDISGTVQEYIEGNGFSVVRELCGHGVGKYLHEEPSVPNFGKKGTGIKLRNGMTLAIEPMVNLGKSKVRMGDDGWTVLTADGSPSAHFEHTILISNGKPEILTVV